MKLKEKSHSQLIRLSALPRSVDAPSLHWFVQWARFTHCLLIAFRFVLAVPRAITMLRIVLRVYTSWLPCLLQT